MHNTKMDDRKWTFVKGVAGVASSLVAAALLFLGTQKILKKMGKHPPRSFPAFEIPTIRENSPLLKNIQTISKEFVSVGRWLRFGTVAYRIEDSTRIQTWELVERTTRSVGNDIDGVDIIGIVHSRKQKKKQIALIVNYRPAVGKFVLELPAGLIEQGETCEAAGIRELKEETGLEGEFKSISPELLVDPWKSNENTKIIQAQIDGDSDVNSRPQQRLADDELIELIYFPIDNLLENLTAFCEKFNTGIDVKLYTFALGLEMGKNTKISD